MSWQQFKHAWLIKFWAPIPAVIAAGILSTYYFGITGTFWAVTGEFTRWGGQLLQLFGVHAEEWGYFKIIHLEGSPLTRIDGMMILGMFGGCFAAALSGQQCQTAHAAQPYPHYAGHHWRYYRRFWRTSGNGL